MQIAVHVLAYNVNRFIRPVLLNMAPFVDKIYVAHSTRPWNYVAGSRDSRVNPTRREDILGTDADPKIELVEGDWLTEEAMRNACFERAKADGFDWLLIQDADEFYPEQSWVQIHKSLRSLRQRDHLITTWYNFWKSSQFVLASASGAIKQTNGGFAIRCRPDLKFVGRRVTNTQHTDVIDCPCYHYGYVMSDAEMLEKISTWGHAHEFNPQQWFHHKWLNWRESSRNLHPVGNEWYRAIRFPLQQPDFAEQFSLPENAVPGISVQDAIAEAVFDVRHNARHRWRSTKKMLRATIEGNRGRQ